MSDTEYYQKFYQGDYAEEHYEKFFERKENHWKRKHERITALLGPLTGKHILDLGCGTGTYAVEYAEGGNTTVGVDYSQAMIETACRIRDELGIPEETCRFVQGDISKPIFENNEFDYIIAGDIVEHLLPRPLHASFKECYRVLKPGGIFFVHTYPTKYDYLTHRKAFLPFLLPFAWLPDGAMSAYMRLLDKTVTPVIYKIMNGKTRREIMEDSAHCNLQAYDEMRDELSAIGFDVEQVVLENTYNHPHEMESIGRWNYAPFKRFSYAKRNIYLLCRKPG